MPSRPPKALFFAGLFAFLGFADSAYLTVDHYLALPVPCGLTGGCETVLKSAYATIGPVPLALLGALYYLAALCIAVYIHTSENPSRLAPRGLLAMSGLGLLASAYLIYIQAAVLHAFCQYCLGSALSSTLLFISAVALWRTMRLPHDGHHEAR